MSDLRGTWIPETSEEMAFVEAVGQRTREAHEDGMEPAEIASALSFMAASILMHSPSHRPVPESPEPPAKTEACPECGILIEDVLWQLGGEAWLDPCDCVVDGDLIEGWADE